jgi:Phage integrase, N-terminal SAM-like domain
MCGVANTGPEAGSLDACAGESYELVVGSYLLRWLTHSQGRVRAVTYEGYEALVRRHALPVSAT